MKFACMIAASLFFTPAVGFAQDAKSMDGTWVPVSAELGGTKLPDALLKTIKMVITGNKYTVTVGNKVDKGTVKRDATKTPKAIDIIGLEGPNKGTTMLAIYKMDKGNLVVCYNIGGKTRPTEFKTKPKTLLYLVTYKKQ